MDNKKKKMIAPIVITIVLIIYYILYFAVLCMAIHSIAIKLVLGIIPIAFSGAMIYVCMQRINEIRSGEEDDLSKY